MAGRERWSWMVLAAAVVAGPCLAQQAPAPASVAPVTGPAFLTVTPGSVETNLELGIQESYQSNVTGASASLAPLRGLTPADFVTSPFVTGVISRGFGRDTFSLQGVFSYVDYARNPVLNRSNIQLSGAGAVPVGICQTTQSVAYSRGQAQLSDLAPASLGSRLLIADIVQDLNGQVSAACGRAVGFAPTVTVSESLVNNSLQGLVALNARVFSANGGVAYRSAAYGVLTATGQYSETDYPDRTIDGSPEKFSTYGGGLSYVTFPYARLQGSAALNYEVLTPLAGIGRDFTGLTYNLQLVYSFTPILSATLTASRATAPSNFPDALFLVRQAYALQADYRLGSRTALSAGVSRTGLTYEDLVFPTLPQLTSETYTRIFASAQRALGRRLTLGVTVAYRQVDANFPGFGYPDITASFSVRSRF